MTDESTDTAAPRKRGWPAGKPRGPRTQQRAPQRAQQGRTAAGRIAFSEDIYAVDLDTLPDHMDYQWVTKSVMGDSTGKVRADYTRMMMNGWTPVDASRLPSYGVPSGELEIGGQVFMERPKEMSEEARAEEWAKATGQVATQLNRLNDVPTDLEVNRPGQAKRGGVHSFGRGEPIAVRSDSDYEAG